MAREVREAESAVGRGDEERMRRGRAMMRRLNEEGAESVIGDLEEIAPDFGDLLVGFVFGDIYGRDVLPLRERQLIRLAALVCLGNTGTPLKANIQACLNIGITQRDIAEAFVQSLPYAGFPRVIEALEVAREMFTRVGDE